MGALRGVFNDVAALELAHTAPAEADLALGRLGT
jgi:hypothetical protein